MLDQPLRWAVLYIEVDLAFSLQRRTAVSASGELSMLDLRIALEDVL